LLAVASGYAPSQLTDGIFLAYTVAEGLRPQLVCPYAGLFDSLAVLAVLFYRVDFEW